MARPKTPTIPDDKIYYFREQLYRELSTMFEWKGLPTTVPADYLERHLVRGGYVLYYEDEIIGQDVLKCEVFGYNRHDLPTQARAFTPNTLGEKTLVQRNIKRLTDGKNVTFDPTTDGVLIMNMMGYNKGLNMGMIVDHFATRLALAQQSFDTNLMWTNLPYIFQVDTDETRLSIEKMFASIFNGEPFIIMDKSLLNANKDRNGLPTDIKFIGKELQDIQNEIMMKFRQTIGFETAGVEKAERVNTMEVESNNSHTQSVLQVMLQQRKIAAKAINNFFGVNVTVDLYGSDQVEEGGDDDGGDDSGTGPSNGEDEF